MPETTRHILCMSGGKDSTALALYMRDRIPEMEYVFCDTDKELTETYEYLNRVEAFLGKKIIRLNAKAGFDHWLEVFGGYLPSPNMRWCTKLLKLKPFEQYVGEQPVISYVGLRADEDRIGYISTKANIKATFPFKEDGIDYAGVMKILEESGIGSSSVPRSGAARTQAVISASFSAPSSGYDCLRPILTSLKKRWPMRKLATKKAKHSPWNQEMPLRELKKPENVAAIKQRFAEYEERNRKNRPNKKLVEILADMENEDDGPKPCLICQL